MLSCDRSSLSLIPEGDCPGLEPFPLNSLPEELVEKILTEVENPWKAMSVCSQWKIIIEGFDSNLILSEKQH